MGAMRHFYGTVMGFELLGELSPTWIEYKMGTNTFALAVRTKPFDDPAPPDGSSLRAPHTVLSRPER